MKMESLLIEADDATLYVANQNSASQRLDSGFDLFMPAEVVLGPNETRLIDLQVRAELVPGPQGPHGFYLFPRSSISKTPLRLANSVGIIDFGYRGSLKVAVHNTGPSPYTIQKGDRLFQLCMPTLSPFQVQFGAVCRLTERGEGGFGSTTASSSLFASSVEVAPGATGAAGASLTHDMPGASKSLS